MGFRFESSVEAHELFSMFWTFLREVKQLPLGRTDLSSYRESWSLSFDSLLRMRPFPLVKDVLQFYINEYKSKKNTYLHLNPDSFIKGFPILEQRYRNRYSPLPEDEIEELMKIFRKYRWKCPDDILSATIGKSLYRLRKLKGGLSHLPPKLQNYVRGRIGYNHAYILRRFIPRSAQPGNTLELTKKPISYEFLYDLVGRYLREYGCRETEVDGYISSIKEAIVAD